MNQTPPPDLVDSFCQYFRLAPALDEATRQETYRVRHDVYCKDLGWEPERADGMESDEYDRYSIPCLMRAAQSGNRVGCLRLVLCKPEDPAFPLPMESSCATTIDHTILDPGLLDRHRIAEVSRLAVTNTYRRRKGEADKPIALDDSDFGDAGQARFPFIPVGLYLSAFAMADELGIDYLLVLTEPRLARHFGRIGFNIHQIGGPIEHRGLRVPSVMETQAVIGNLHPMMARMWQHIRATVAASFAAADQDLHKP